ncbi:tRNA lysidine(34) synthetase TilS [Cellulomonas palmilytica]|uniref:tRNA lysidine(34) synthetase TilS n=1 Tax=Cellulomonas palmilytica TaxID=2608402 RepID=UPI001F27D1DE|nr:tRNA lysidine(34) synthetase TilS [Cellulomonas palmilytica]UJP40899.1 tRNA lysidine(34) synthetase TilS [Cellulomonas palmilytica]
MVGPDPRVAAARRAVAAAVADLPDDALVLVACSGGPDSLALAAAAAFAVPRSARSAGGAAGVGGSGGPAGSGRGVQRASSDDVRRRAGAVVVDHGLVPGSADVAVRAAQQCRALGLDPVLVVRVAVEGPGGPEAAARAARYAALDRAADETGAAAVLLGHTLDDQAETVLLGLARGSGARSLAGMPAVRGRLRRPFLDLRRTDTLGICEVLGLDPWHDPTNAGQPGDPLRSRVRAHVLPVLERELGPGVATALARTASHLREDGSALDEQAAALLHDAREHARRDAARRDPAEGDDARGDDDAGPGGDATDVVVLDVATLVDAAPAVRRRALRAALVAAGAPAGSVHRVHVLELDALLTDWHGQGPLTLPGRVVAVRRCGRLVVTGATRVARPGTNRPGEAEST